MRNDSSVRQARTFPMRRGARAALKLVFDGIQGLSAVYKETGRRFTVDGRLVGDVGEAIAHSDYGVVLHKNQRKGTDGTYGERGVQVKATFKEHITFTKAPAPDILVLCFKLHSDRDKGGSLVGHYTEVYNGPSHRLISRYWPAGSGGQCRPSVEDLSTLTGGNGLARTSKVL